jgi:hypothetical protein
MYRTLISILFVLASIPVLANPSSPSTTSGWTIIGESGTLVLTLIVYSAFGDVFVGKDKCTWVALYSVLVGACGTYALFSALRIGWQRKHIPCTKLLVQVAEEQKQDFCNSHSPAARKASDKQ